VNKKFIKNFGQDLPGERPLGRAKNYDKILGSIKARSTLIIQENKLSKEVPVLCLSLGHNICFRAHYFLMSTEVLKLRGKTLKIMQLLLKQHMLDAVSKTRTCL